jgi:hypothetical protein
LGREAGGSVIFRNALQRVWVWDLPSDAFARIEQAAGEPLPRPKEGVVIEIVRAT